MIIRQPSAYAMTLLRGGAAHAGERVVVAVQQHRICLLAFDATVAQVLHERAQY